MNIASLAAELTIKILTAARVDLVKLRARPAAGSRETLSTAAEGAKWAGQTRLVLIGSSTGGPQALRQVLGRIPAGYPYPILVVQHMTPGFTASLSERLDAKCAIRVKEAADGELLVPGTVYLAPAGLHLKVVKNGADMTASLGLAPHDAIHRPSVDVLFESAATAFGPGCVAVVLTGMGRDGAVGAEAIKRKGGRVFAESEDTAVVYGMPRAVVETVQVDGVLPLYAIADVIIECGSA